MNLINYQIKGIGVGENQDKGLGIILFHSIKMYFVLYSMVKGLCFDLFQGLCILLGKKIYICCGAAVKAEIWPYW